MFKLGTQPQTTRAGANKFDFSSADDEKLSQRERLEYDYLRKRDPMKEFFALVSYYPQFRL
jgi:hypothetical protein